MAEPTATIAIPTLNRGAVLVATVESLLTDNQSVEILVVDQTEVHPKEVEVQLLAWSQSGAIRWRRLPAPSIPAAMNVALREASGEIVLFLDDDIVPGDGLVTRHVANYAEPNVVAVVGQVIQPWQEPQDVPRPKRRAGIWEDLDFPFNSTHRAVVRNCIACNFSVRRAAALACGAFDKNFIGAAYRFETEFCRRLSRHGGKVIFDPEASVRHLKLKSGGTRVFGDGVRGSRVEHSVGAYYFAFLESSGFERIHYMLRTLCSTTFSRFYATRPWLIPRHVFRQIASIKLARRLYHEKKSKLVAA